MSTAMFTHVRGSKRAVTSWLASSWLGYCSGSSQWLGLCRNKALLSPSSVGLCSADGNVTHRGSNVVASASHPDPDHRSGVGDVCGLDDAEVGNRICTLKNMWKPFASEMAGFLFFRRFGGLLPLPFP